MFYPKTGQELFAAMQNRAVVGIGTYKGAIQAIEIESGEGRTFNVTLLLTEPEIRLGQTATITKKVFFKEW